MPPRKMPERIQKHLNMNKPPQSMIITDEDVSPYKKLLKDGKKRFVSYGRTIIYGVFFICCIGAYKEIVAEQMASVERSGLLAKTTTLFCFICQYDPEIMEVLKPYGPKLRIISTTENLYEKFALENFRSYIPPTSSHYYMYYFHSKGVSRKQESYHTIRRNLDYFILEKHDACIFWLDHGYDAVGASFSLYPTLHFSGNFWWATSRHLGRLPSELRDTYYAPEMYVCGVSDGRYISVCQQTNNKSLEEIGNLTTDEILRQSTCVPIRNNICKRMQW